MSGKGGGFYQPKSFFNTGKSLVTPKWALERETFGGGASI